MAEATDRPQASPEPAPPDAVMTGEQHTALAPPAAETYQALSLMALAGLGIGIIYSVIVLIGGAVALFGRIPWLMPYWTFLIPVAAVLVCAAARTRIRDSEGTLSGAAFATWGSRLAILFGLTYAAYYAATFFVVRSQAVDVADRFFEQIKQGHPELAFLMGQGITIKGMTPAEARETVESRFNMARGRGGAVGPYTRFREDIVVRFIELDGENAKISMRGVSDWEYKEGGYRMALNYHIVTSLAEFDAKVETFGHDPKPGEPKGRQWKIAFANGVAAFVAESKKLTPEGQLFTVQTLLAQNFVVDWMNKVNDGQWRDAYFDTLKPSERERAKKEPNAAKLDPGAELNKLIRIDDKTFWAGQKQREEYKQRIGKTFHLSRSQSPTFNMILHQQALPVVRHSGNEMAAFFDVSLYYLDESTGTTHFVADGRLEASAEEQAAAEKASNWRIEALYIDTGRSPPTPTMQQRQMQPLPGQAGQQQR